jgi:hypothetical protein
MSVISVQEQFKGRGGSEKWDEGGTSLTINRTRTFLVETDSDFDNEANVLSHGSLPRPGDSYGTARCVSRSAKQMSQGPRWWKTVFQYSSKLTAGQKKQFEDDDPDPVSRRIKVDWSVQRYEKVIDRDRDNFPIQNAAFDSPDPPPVWPKGNIVATVTGNVLDLEPWILEDYPFSLNDADFTLRGFPIKKEKAMLTDVQITDELYEDTYKYFTVKLQIEISTRPQGHQLWILNQGLMQLDRETGDKVDCVILKDTKDKKFVPVSQPVLLDIDDGFQLSKSEIQYILDHDESEEKLYTKWDIGEPKDWTKLGLPA